MLLKRYNKILNFPFAQLNFVIVKISYVNIIESFFIRKNFFVLKLHKKINRSEFKIKKTLIFYVRKIDMRCIFQNLMRADLVELHCCHKNCVICITIAYVIFFDVSFIIYMCQITTVCF